eukprot:SAG31_NODE_20819_length_564_cov_2.144086_1_plen_57_part_01
MLLSSSASSAALCLPAAVSLPLLLPTVMSNTLVYDEVSSRDTACVRSDGTGLWHYGT